MIPLEIAIIQRTSSEFSGVEVKVAETFLSGASCNYKLGVKYGRVGLVSSFVLQNYIYFKDAKSAVIIGL